MPVRSFSPQHRMLAAMVLACAVPVVHAQAYPTGPVRVVVPFPAGSGVDGVARNVIARMATGLGQPIVIENRAGAGGNIGTEFVARAPKDGYTLLFNATQLVGDPGISNVKYNAVKDFAPIALVSRVSAMLVVPPDSPAESVQELIALAKEKSGSLSYASGGNGGIGHYSGELFKSNGGNLDIVHVPYKSAAEQVTSVMTNQTQLAFPALQIALPQVKAGKLRALGVTGPRRSAQFPDVPTMAEAMKPGFTLDAWYGLLAPAGTPAAVVTRLNAELVKVLADPAVRESLSSASQDIVGSTPGEFAEVIAHDLKLWTDLAVQLKVEADDGTEGYSLARSHGGQSGAVIANQIEASLRALVLGRDVADREAVWHAMAAMEPSGYVSVFAISALDVALWDLAGRVQGAPVAQLCGGRRRSMRAYASSSHHASVDAYVADLQAALALGFTAYKVHPFYDAARDIALAGACATPPGRTCG